MPAKNSVIDILVCMLLAPSCKEKWQISKMAQIVTAALIYISFFFSLNMRVLAFIIYIYAVRKASFQIATKIEINNPDATPRAQISNMVFRYSDNTPIKCAGVITFVASLNASSSK